MKFNSTDSKIIANMGRDKTRENNHGDTFIFLVRFLTVSHNMNHWTCHPNFICTTANQKLSYHS